jgi:hypothetical protein
MKQKISFFLKVLNIKYVNYTRIEVANVMKQTGI